jgi:hypothetical protein
MGQSAVSIATALGIQSFKVGVKCPVYASSALAILSTAHYYHGLMNVYFSIDLSAGNAAIL